MNGLALVRLAKRRGYLWRACSERGQRMVVARSGKQCLNCGTIEGIIAMNDEEQ